MITGINHITFAVADLRHSLPFYRDVLGCKEVMVWGGGAYLEAGDLWICLSIDATANGEAARDYSHVAFSVAEEDFQTLKTRIVESGAKTWKENRSEGESLYFCDPSGHRLEIHIGSLSSRLSAMGEKRAGCGAGV